MNKFFYIFVLFLMSYPTWSGIPFMVRDSTSSRAYHQMRWSNPNNIQVYINASSSPTMFNEDVFEEIQAAITTWNAVSSSSAQVTTLATSITPVRSDSNPDFQNHISFSSQGLNPLIVGITYVTANTDTGQIVDADMVFNTNFTFVPLNQGPTDINARRVVLRSVATHEFGHLFGFDHSPIKESVIDGYPIPESTMYPYLSDSQQTLEQDDISILSYTYPSGSNEYTHQLHGEILNGIDQGRMVNGAHVVAWDNVNTTHRVISAISGFTTTGYNLDGYFRINGLAPGNYKVYIEPFPISDGTNSLTVENNTDIFNWLSSFERYSWTQNQSSFDFEFWNNQSESKYETTSGYTDAYVLTVNGTENRYLEFVTNVANSLPSLNQKSEFAAESQYVYADGESSTILRFTPKDIYGQTINADISSNLRFSITTGSFSATSTILETIPNFDASNYSYYLPVYSPKLLGDLTQTISNCNIEADGQTVYTEPYKLYFEKASKDKTEIVFIPNIYKFNKDGLTQNSIDVFANGSFPATWQISPKFSNGSEIPISITTDPNVTYFVSTGLDPSLTTQPIVSIGQNKFQTTMTSSIPAVLTLPSFRIDDVLIFSSKAIRFSNVSDDSSRFHLDSKTIHVSHPSLAEVPKAWITIEPCFSDGSNIPAKIDTSTIDIVVTHTNSGAVADITKGDFTTETTPNDEYFYKNYLEAPVTLGSLNIKVSVNSVEFTTMVTLNIEVTSPTKTEINQVKHQVLLGSSQESEIRITPKFSDGSMVGIDMSNFLYLTTSLGNLSNGAGEVTTTLFPAIKPDYTGGGVHTVKFHPGDILGEAKITGRINALGWQEITDHGLVKVLDANPNLISVFITDREISANGQDITTITVIPFFPNGDSIGPELNENNLTLSSTEGEFLRKTPSPVNPADFIFENRGKTDVPMFNNNDGTFEISLRSTNYSTTAVLSIFYKSVLSLTQEQVSFTTKGSANPSLTLINTDPEFIYGNGTSLSTVRIYPRATNGEMLSLPTTSQVIITPQYGETVGAVVRHEDGSFSQKVKSIRVSQSVTSYINVIIDSVQMTPSTSPSVKFINLDVSSLVPSNNYPNNNRVDGFDAAILSRTIRNHIRGLSSEKCAVLNDCVLDFNQDGYVDVQDMEILMNSFGESTE
jgi:hypothetical protein